MGFPCRFKSINGVSVHSSLESGWGSFGLIWFRLSERTLRCFNVPMLLGKDVRPLSSRFNSFSLTKEAIVSGSLVSELDERSSFSSILRGLSTRLFGMTENPLLARSIDFKPLGRGDGRALAGSTGLGTTGLPVFLDDGMILLPSELLLADNDLSLGRDEITAKVPGVSLLLSTFKDFKTLRLDRFGSNFLSLFLDKSSVVSLEILRKEK